MRLGAKIPVSVGTQLVDGTCLDIELGLGISNDAVEPTSLGHFDTEKDFPEDLCGSQEGCLEDLRQYCTESKDSTISIECEEQVAWMLTGKSKVYHCFDLIILEC